MQWYLLLNHQLHFQVSLRVENIELPVHVVILWLHEFNNKWRQLHEHRPSNTRRWSVLISISESTLIIDSIEQPPQHKYWGKERTLMIMLRLMTSGRSVGAGV